MESDRLVLRQFTSSPADIELLVELDSDPEVMRFLTGSPTPPAEITDVIVPTILNVYQDHPGLGTFAAHEKHTGTFIGWFGLQPTADPTTVDVGYRLNRASWGNGYATEGTKLLIDYAFTHLNKDRVIADTMAVNHRSRAVMRRSGLRFTRLWHEHFDDPLPGTEFGEVEYAIDRHTWETRPRA